MREQVSLEKKSGGDGAVDTPVPIPNTEVKHRSGEGIQLVGENSALPGFFFDNLSIEEKKI